jgi:hypothetical protein
MLLFAPEIALRVEGSDPDQLRNCGNIKPLYKRGRGERKLDIAQTIGLNCGVTHSPGKIEYNCHYFLMTFSK